MSLAGRTILITRPLAQSLELARQLESEGAHPVLFPLIEITPQSAALQTLAATVNQADWLVFVSPSAIDCAWPHLPELAANVRLACIGAASASRLGELSGREVLYAPDVADSDHLLQQAPLQHVAGQRIVIVRGVGGREELPQALASRGADVRLAEIYRRETLTPDWSEFDRLIGSAGLDACIVTSSEIAERLFRLAGSARMAALQCLQYCVPHPRIAQRLVELGVVRIVTTRADNAAMIAGLREWFSRHP